MFFSRKRKKIERVLVVDIGSGSVGVAIATTFNSDSKIPALVEAVFRSPIQFSGEFDFAKFLSSAESALEKCLKNLHDAKAKRPDTALLVFASPWYNASPRVASISKGVNFVFSEKEMQTILKNEKDLLVRDISKNNSNDIDNFVILDEVIHSVNLNGYPQDNPIGKTTKSASIKMFMTITEKIVFEKIKSKVKNFFPHIHIVASSFMNALFVSLRDIKMIEDDTVLIDIGGEMTEIVKVSHGTINSVASFPSGRMKIIRKMQERGVNENILRMYEKGELTPAEVQNLDKTIAVVMEDWKEEIKNTLMKFDGGFLRAKKVCITLDEDVIKIFYSPVIDVLNGLVPVNPPEVVIVRPDRIEPHIKFADKVPRDEFLMIETIKKKKKIFE